MFDLKCKAFLLVGLLSIPVGCSDEKRTPPAPDADNGGLVLPDGFRALVVADSTGPARHMAVNTNGDIYVKLRISKGDKGNVALRDNDGDGRADLMERFGDYPNDGSFATEMRIHEDYLYYSSELVVYRQKLHKRKLIPEGRPEVVLSDHHPLQWHNAKCLAFDDDGHLYVTFSAPTNACEDWNSVDYSGTNSSANVKGMYPCPQLFDQGGIWRFDANKLNQRQADGQRYATGLRSIVAMAWNKDDNSLYAVQHGRDYLHQHAPEHFSKWANAVLPAEELVNVKPGEDYGWPYTYFDSFKNKKMLAPEYGGDGTIEAPASFARPLMGLPAHWAPNDLLFYRGHMFPDRYRSGAFVAFHGSTNRGPYPQGGYIVAFIPFQNGRPTGEWEVFADGFAGVEVIKAMPDARYRPMGLAEGPDGSLYVVESVNGKIWRILFSGDRNRFGEVELAPMERLKTRSYLRTPDESQDLLPSN